MTSSQTPETRRPWVRAATFVASVALLLLIATAILIQNFTGAVPMGLFNSGVAPYQAGSVLCLLFALGGIVVLVDNAINDRWARAAGAVRGVLFALVILEGLVWGADRLLAGRDAVGLLGGPQRELITTAGTRLILTKPNRHSPLGFCTDHRYALRPSSPRLLFLGDSYTEGSGSSDECNYPSVVERVLSDSVGAAVEVMNAGVSGYGPRDAIQLLRGLVEMGYEFDAVVWNAYLGNDFTDNLPGTTRRVVAGMAFRYPESWFLRTFHPFNWHLTRWTLFVKALVQFRGSPGADVAQPGEGTCDLSVEPLREVSPYLSGLIYAGLNDAARAEASNLAKLEFAATVEELEREVEALGVPLIVVVFPSRVIADESLRSIMELDERDIEPARALRAYLQVALNEMTVIDVLPALRGHDGMYLENETHLSDAGNVAAGERVGAKLFHILWRTDSRGR